MRNLLRFFRNRWFLSALGLGALALIIWLLGPLIAIADQPVLASVSARIAAILLVLVCWLLVLLFQLWRTRRKEQQMISDLAAIPAEEKEQPADAVSEEQEILRERFEQAVELLRRPREKGRKAASLYELPWYLIIGPPGCGKTTALANAGLDFPLADRLGQQSFQGVGGTRNCDWWISDEAVLLDTAGRYTTQDSEAAVDQAAWFSFLDLLKKYRRRQPLNGVILAFSIADLLTLDEEGLARHCRAIRKRLQELLQRIGISLPVYLLFTKADLLAGFLEFFEDLGREERQQVWGATFPLFREPPDYAARFAPEFELLLQRLYGRRNDRLIAERDPQRRALILGFPQQFAALQDPLERFLRGIFQGSRFEQPVRLRGVYFSSGTQEGTPIDRILGNLAESLGQDRRSVLAGSRGKSYFLGDLLRRVIFQEQALAGSDRRAERLRAWMQWGAYALIALTTLLFALAWAASYANNRALLTELASQLQRYETLIAENKISSALAYEEILPRLDALRGMLDQVQPSQSTDLSMRLGLYRGEEIQAQVRGAYVRALNALLVPGLASQLEERLAHSLEDPSQSYELLKRYLMLAEPEHLEKESLLVWAKADWKQRYPNSAIPARLSRHLAYLLEQDLEPIAPNRLLVRAVREQLEQQPLAELVYGRLKLVPAVREAAPLTIQDIAGRNAETVFDLRDPKSLEIPALFTYRGFYQLFQPQSLQLIQRARKESWVYGKPTPVIAGQFEDLEESVLDLYIDEYILRWDNLLSQLNLRAFTTVREATEKVAQLIRPDSPLKRVLDTLNTNTKLARLPKGTGAIGKIALEDLRRKNPYLSRLIGEAQRSGELDSTSFPPKRVEYHFAPLTRLVDGSGSVSLEDIQRLLSDLYSQLSAIEPESGFSENPFRERDIFQRLRTEAARSPDPVRRWLRQVAANAQAVALGDAGERINGIYQSSVRPLCYRLSKGRYPFSRSRREISVYDFGRLFAKEGLLDSFFQEQLAPYVDTSRHPWRWRKKAKQSLGFSDQSLATFEQAQAIQQAFFPEGGKLPDLRFSLIPRRLDPASKTLIIRFGGQELRFITDQPAPVDGRWPGPNPSGFLTLEVTDREGQSYETRRTGQWAFYRMVNPGRLRPGADRFRTRIRVGEFSHSFEVRAFSVLNPFGLQDLTGFRCPDQL